MPELKDFYFPSADMKNQIYVRMWKPDEGVEIKGTVQISHGIAEYINRYDDFAKFLASNGFVVAGDDHLGHGKSVAKDEDKVFFSENDGWNTVVSDLKTLHDTLKEKYPNVPSILFGHSMGSFLARTYIIKYPNDFDAAIISGTGNQPKALVNTGLFLGKIVKGTHSPRYVSKFLNDMSLGSYNKGFDAAPGETAWLSTDKEMVKLYDTDPFCGAPSTCGLFCDMMGGIKFITDTENLQLMNKDMPVYFMSGADDPVGEKGKGVNRAYKLFCDTGMKDVKIRLYPGGRHEMLNEVNRADVYQDVLNWITEKI